MTSKNRSGELGEGMVDDQEGGENQVEDALDSTNGTAMNALEEEETSWQRETRLRSEAAEKQEKEHRRRQLEATERCIRHGLI